jgi:hypothetical protein
MSETHDQPVVSSPRFDPTDRRHRLVALAGITLAGAVGRLYRIGSESLWLDELITLEFVLGYGPLELVTVIPTQQPHLPAYYVLLDLWVSAFGAAPATLRLLSALFGVAAIPLVYLVGRRLFDPTTGLWAAAFLAASRFLVYHSQNTRMYAMLVALALGSYYLFVRLDGLRERVGYAATTALTALTHPFGWLVPVAQGVPATDTWLRDGRDRRPLLLGWGIAVCGVLGAVVALPGDIPGIEARSLVSVPLTLGRFFVGGSWTAGLAVVLPLTVLVAAGTLRATRENRRTGLLLVAWLAVPLVVVVAISYLATPVFRQRFVLYAAPAAMLLAARGVTALRASRVGPALGVVVLAVMLVAVGGYHATDNREQWAEAVGTVEAEAGDDAAVLVADAIATRNYVYYADRDLPVVGVVGERSGTGRSATPPSAIRDAVAGHPEVWVVFTHISDPERQELRAVLDGDYRASERYEFVGVDVVRFERRGDQRMSTVRSTGRVVSLGARDRVGTLRRR